MIVLAEWSGDLNKWAFIAIALAVTLLLAVCFEKIYALVDKICIHKTEKTALKAEK